METNRKTIRVLMIGPGEGVTGGIAALVETFVPVLEKQVSLQYLPSVKKRELKDSGKLSLRNLANAVSQYARFLVALLRFRPQIIHLHTSQGIAWLKDTFYVLAGKAFGARIVLHMHGGNFDAIYQASPRMLQRYTRLILDRADAVVSVSTEWKTRLARLLPVDRVFSFTNCIDVQAYCPGDPAQAAEAVNIFFLGRIGPQKGAFDLIEAIHALPPVGGSLRVWMAGPEERDGDFQRARVLLDTYQLADTCELLGYIQRDQARALFQTASVFVLPSSYEGLPMAVLEALAAGLPVVATAVGGIPEVVREGENGFLIAPGDVPALARTLARLIADAPLRRRMGQCSRDLAVSELDVRAYVEKMTALYSSLVGADEPKPFSIPHS